MSLTSVLVFGSSGGFGQFVIQKLIDRKSEFARIAAFVDTTREITKAKADYLQDLEGKGVELVRGSPFDSEVYKGFAVVLAILGNHAIKNQPKMIDAAITAGVRHWYPSEFGADLTVPGNWEERYYRDKVITRDYLKTKATEVEGFRYTYVVYGRFTEWAPLPHFGIHPREAKANIVGRPEMKQSLIAVKDGAAYLVASLLRAPREPERTFRFVGGDYSWTTLFETLERVQGKKWEVTYKSVENARAMQKKAIQTGDVDLELAASHQVIQGTGRTLVPTPWDNDSFLEVTTADLESTFKTEFQDVTMRVALGTSGFFAEVF